MPSVTITSTDLQAEGPVMEVHFLIPLQLEKVYLASGSPIPPPVMCKALIDTGASSSVVQDTIPKKLGLSPIGTTSINTASSQNHPCAQYFIRMVIPAYNLTYEGVFTSMPLQGQNIDSLIGRDLLGRAILIYIGYAHQFTLSLL